MMHFTKEQEAVIQWAVERGLVRTGRGCLKLPIVAKQSYDDKGRLRVTMTTSANDRHGDIIEPKGGLLANFRKSPRVQWSHDYSGLPIARAEGVLYEGDSLTCSILWWEGKEQAEGSLAENLSRHQQFVNEIRAMYEHKPPFLNTWSIGFLPIKWKEIVDEKTKKFIGYHLMKWELIELSAVPIAANPEAISQIRAAGIVTHKGLIKSLGLGAMSGDADIDAEVKGVIPYQKTPKEDEAAAWSGPREIAAAEVSDLKAMCAWVDPDNAAIKQGYKLPHHRAKGHNLVWRGVAAAMGALLGARGGVKIPSADKKGVYNHLAKHYKEYDKDAPEFRDAPDIEDAAIEKPDAEQKPGWDEGENTIRYQVRPMEKFEKDTMKTVPLKKDKPRVNAVMGKLKGESGMTIQSLMFPKEDDWTLAEAKKWLKAHPDVLKACTEMVMAGLVEKHDEQMAFLTEQLDEAQMQIKEGRVLSGKNRRLLQECSKQMMEAIEAIDELLEATEPVKDEGKSLDAEQKIEPETEPEMPKKKEASGSQARKVHVEMSDADVSTLAGRVSKAAGKLLVDTIGKLTEAELNKRMGRV